MYATSNRSPPQSRSTSPPWYTRFPELDPVDDYSHSWPPQMLQIADHELERIALLPKTSRSSQDPTDLRQNQRAGYLGEGILTALISDFLYTEFIEYSERDLSAMRQALLDPMVLSNLCQRINLQYQLAGSSPDRHPGDQSLALTFEAYIGGLYHDRGADGYPELRDWFYFLIKPYAMMCKSNYEQYIEANRPVARDPRYASPSSVSLRQAKMYSVHEYALEEPAIITRPGTAAPDLRMYATSSAADLRGGSRGKGDYIKELKEYCEKSHFASPVYHDRDNGENGDFIKWFSRVTIDGNFVGEGTSWANTKKEARAMASKVALNYLRGRS
ncbi:hypothetical protein ABW20_dc0109134 [Dactylellina cionopaga]|nr:hypothetical protein ABW20_dc0109134 [Dactylellina cionopaga]